MKNTENSFENESLRNKAEQMLQKKKAGAAAPFSKADTLKLIHELEIHQIELELQNEELLSAKEKVDAANGKYIELYDFAPTGYFTLTRDGTIIDLNLLGAQMLGKERVYFYNKRFGVFVAVESLPRFNLFLEKAFQNKKSETCEIVLMTSYETPLYVQLSAAMQEEGAFCFVTAVDVTKRTVAENEIKRMLAEKEVMLVEVHHRIKNNMNSIIGLLSIQMDETEQPEVVQALQEAQLRIGSMMVLYDKLYVSCNFKEISINEYLTSLTSEILSNFPHQGIVKTDFRIDDFILDVKFLVPVGIIVNELICNSMKHAFCGKECSTITISASKNNNQVMITIRDNGTGMPEPIDRITSAGFGMKLVEMLTEQISGTLTIDRIEGTAFILKFAV